MSRTASFYYSYMIQYINNIIVANIVKSTKKFRIIMTIRKTMNGTILEMHIAGRIDITTAP